MFNYGNLNLKMMYMFTNYLTVPDAQEKMQQTTIVPLNDNNPT